MTRLALGLAVLLLAVTVLVLHAQTPSGVTGSFLQADAVSWKSNTFEVARWKTLVGGIEGGQLEQPDVQFGLWQLAPGATYHGHRHPAPEIYHIMSGRARWTVGSETREVRAGTTIYTPPGQVHRMVNLTDEPVDAIWIWWAPGGDTSVFSGPYEFTEPPPQQPGNARFGDPVER